MQVVVQHGAFLDLVAKLSPSSGEWQHHTDFDFLGTGGTRQAYRQQRGPQRAVCDCFHYVFPSFLWPWLT
ncbi:hypothetical protein [Candidatus Entotheonella palauensis]|uniref:hypothetical protein n=1 Tax=Candidatus Entotheonella palauensis TaxID=93172 RepID=UPI0015C43D0D|nr:hypothetical protein [Candidatus Entotheonella palauensis]